MSKNETLLEIKAINSKDYLNKLMLA